MKPKGKDVKAKQIYKPSALLKDVVPSYCKNLPRDPRPFKQPDNIQGIHRQPEFEPLPEPDEWPGDDALKIDLASGDSFRDKFDWLSVLGNQFYVLRRPKDYLRQQYEVEDIAEAPIFNKTTKKDQFDFLFMKEDKYSTVFETPEKIQFMSNLLNDQICICESFEREETHEECDRRKKEQIEKITLQQSKEKKKPAKKPEELVEEGPLKIRDVRLSDVQVSSELAADSRWIGSQLQIIKDRDVRDVNNGKALWSKIYPQQDGAPVFNPNGRYWVKVYYMGKERKIEVDDRVPCSGNQPLLPQSASPKQLWPILVTKAIFKLLQYQRMTNPNKKLTGEGFVMYSLMGLITETISLKNISSADWAVVSEMLSDPHYNRKDVFITAFTQADTIPSITSNSQKKKSKEYINEMVKNANKGNENFEQEENLNMLKANTDGDASPSISPQKVGSQVLQQQQPIDDIDEDEQNTMAIKPINFSLDKFKRRRSESEVVLPDPEDTQVIPGYAYSIVESFQNRQFNMVYVQKRSDREMRLRIEYYDICKTIIHKMQKEEKLAHRNRKKDIRAKLNDEDKRRIELITQAAIQHRVLRIKTGNCGSPQPSVYCQFSAEELYIAKKCITNRVSKPPNYDVPEIRGDDKSMASQTLKNMAIDETFTVKPLDDFSALPNIQEPFRREGGGFWMIEKDFLQLFEHLQLCYDPKKQNQNQVVNIPANHDNEIATYESMEMLIVQRNPDQEESGVVSLLVGFQAKYPQNADVEYGLKPFTVLQRFDLEQYESVKDYKVLDSYLSGQLILLDNKNNIFRIQTFSPLQYTLWLSSSNTIQMCSVFDYLTEYEGYNAKNFVIDYPPIATKKYFLFFRFKIQIIESSRDTISFVFRVKSTTDNNMLKGMRLKLCEVPTDSNYMLNTIEGVHKNLYETIYLVQGTQRISLRKETQYYFLLEGTTSYAIQEGALEVDFLTNSDSQVQIEQQESVEPVDLIDKYIPTKYGIIFREKLFVNDLTISSLFVRLGEVQKQEVIQVDKKAPPAKGKGPDLPEIVDTELKEQKLIKLELFHNHQLIMYSYGFNQAILSNVSLKSTKDETQSYILQASFDLREWPEAKELTHETEFINWFLTMFSTDTIAVVRDTTKEDREKAIKKSWEDKEIGRAEKAKKSRQKFLLQQKQLRGESLGEEDLALLNAPRVSRKQREEEAKQLILQKGKAAKKEEKKPAKGGKKEEVQEMAPIVHIEYPKSKNHTNLDIVVFLQHLEQERLSEQYALHAGLINVRTDQQKKEIYEAVKMAQDETIGIITRNMMLREELKLYQKDQRDSFMLEYQQWRQTFKENWEEFSTSREGLRQQMSSKIKKERDIIEICRQEKPTILPEDFEKLLQDAQDTVPNINEDLIKVAQKVLKNIKINVLSEKLSNAVQNYDIDIIKTCLEQIEINFVEGIDPQTIEKAQELLEEARLNPNFLAEKQAELKKTSKKGKK